MPNANRSSSLANVAKRLNRSLRAALLYGVDHHALVGDVDRVQSEQLENPAMQLIAHATRLNLPQGLSSFSPQCAWGRGSRT
jgi:hypothetical protein